MLNRKLIYINLLLIAVFFAKEISATHLVGGFISYQYQSLTASGARYLVTIKAYRDCRPNPSVDFASNIDVCVYRRDNSQLHRTETFRLISKKPLKIQSKIGRREVIKLNQTSTTANAISSNKSWFWVFYGIKPNFYTVVFTSIFANSF